MKITKSQLRQIIKEELERLNEDEGMVEVSDPVVHDIIAHLEYTMIDKIEEFEEEEWFPRATAEHVMEAVKIILDVYWGKPREPLTGQAALQEELEKIDEEGYERSVKEVSRVVARQPTEFALNDKVVAAQDGPGREYSKGDTGEITSYGFDTLTITLDDTGEEISVNPGQMYIRWNKREGGSEEVLDLRRYPKPTEASVRRQRRAIKTGDWGKG